MAKPGRKPIPNALKRQKGTDQPCRMNVDTLQFPTPERGDSDPPSCVKNEYALEMWDDMHPMLMANKVLTKADLRQLAVTCMFWGQIALDSAAGRPISAANASEMRKQFAEFGMTPSSRARVGASSEVKENKFSGRGRRVG